MASEERRLLLVLSLLLIGLLCTFTLLVTGVCSSCWYTTHPLAPIVNTTFGSIGLIEHCSRSKDNCKERGGILAFTEEYWPYRPLKSRDFDTVLFLLILTMLTTVLALVLTSTLCFYTRTKTKWLRMALFSTTALSAILGIASVIYLDTKVKSDKFRNGWSSYVIWVADLFLIFVNAPALYLVATRSTHLRSIVKIFHGSHEMSDDENRFGDLLITIDDVD